MTTIGVILNKLMSSKCISVDVITFSEFELCAASYSVATIVLQLDDDSFLFIDALKLFSDQPLTLTNGETITPVSSWEEFNTYISGLETDILQKYLTVSIVPRYWQKEKWTDDNGKINYKSELTPFFSNTGSQLRIRSIENSFGFDVQYCDHNNFYERRNLGKSWNYPDISIINTGAGDSINLHNSIPIVNGAVFYPEVRLNAETGYEELIAHEAGKWLITSDWNQANVKTVKHNKIHQDDKLVFDIYEGGEESTENAYCYNKNIMLVDFSPVGNISIIKLSDCLNGKIEHDYNDIVNDPIPTITDKRTNIHTAYIKGDIHHPRCSYYTITFDLPTGTEIGIPIVCIGGRLFYLHDDSEIRVSDNKISLSVKIDRALFNNIILSNLQWFGKQNLDTSIVEEKALFTLNELFKDTAYGNGTPEDIARLRHEDNSVPFVIMLHTDKTLVCSKCEPIMTIGPDKFLFPPNAGGLLVNKRTREIVDYVRQFYASGTLVETTLQRPINYINKDIKQITSDSLAFEFNNYRSKSKYKNFDTFVEGRNINEYVLIDFAYTESPNGSE